MFKRIALLAWSSIAVMFVMCSIAPHMAEAKILFKVRIDYDAGGAGPISVAIGDLDGDGALDLAVANWDSANVSVLLGNGDGTFQSAVNYGAGSMPYYVAIGDLDGNGDLDMAVANAWNYVSVLLGNGDGTFQSAVHYDAGGGSVAIGDLDGDGALDLAVANWDSANVSVLLGNGDGTFQSAVNYGAGESTYSVAIGDLDGDGALDLSVANRGSHNVSVLLGNGDGTFQSAVNYGADHYPRSVAIGDLDGDADLDLAVANTGSDNVSILINIYVAITIDNGDEGTSSTGTWNVSTYGSPYGEDSLYSYASGSTYTWEAALNGTYEVSLWWRHYYDRCTDVPVKIYDGDTLLDTVYVNQQVDGGHWNLMDTYGFTGTARVVITSQGGCSTCADAVKFVSIVTPELDHIEIEGAVSVNENCTADYNVRAYYTDGTDQLVEPDTWAVDCPDYADVSATGLLSTYEVETDQTCRISASYTEGGIPANATYDITILNFVPPELDHIEIQGPESVNENTTGNVYTCTAYYNDGTNQAVQPDAWAVDCPTYAQISTDGKLDAGEVDQNQVCQISASYTEGAITADDTFDVTILDFVPDPEVIIDNGDEGASSTGNWSLSVHGDPYGGDSLYTYWSGYTYTWEATLNGTYEVSLWWRHYYDRCTDVPVKIYDGDTLLDTLYVNQRVDGGYWNLMDTYGFTGTARIVITSQVGCSTCADAVRFVQ